MDKIEIQKKIAKLRDVTCHYNKTHIIAKYICDSSRGKNQYKTVEKLKDDILSIVDVEIDNFYTNCTSKGWKSSQRVFVVEIKIPERTSN
ncbi:hypothetical protein [Bacillus thuringiensis]|uniref:hypothetical protein n=1 Tax=Bacillus thuringiensis TaxID=1428 RepID=UPI0021D66B13|nr:hypothetical protein [Bacillus thuringiensis]MCU7667419.1 hypothetical protein [Bacillus thuringiensis]